MAPRLQRAGKWQELQFVCDKDRHQVQLVKDETFPLRVQESSGQAWKVLADKVAWPPKSLQKHLWAEQGKAALPAACYRAEARMSLSWKAHWFTDHISL